MRKRLRTTLVGMAGILAGLVLVILVRVIGGSISVVRSANGVGQATDRGVAEASGLSMDDADGLTRAAPHPDFIDFAALKAIKDHPSVVLVDIRTPWEWRGGRIPGAVLIPLQELTQRRDEIPRDRHVILYCRTANRTRQGLRILRDAGYPSVRHLRGGINAWRDPLETDPAPGHR